LRRKTAIDVGNITDDISATSGIS